MESPHNIQDLVLNNLAKLGNNRSALPLMNAAFGPSGPLRDPEEEAGEVEAVRNLFVGMVVQNLLSYHVVDARNPWQLMRLVWFASTSYEFTSSET